MMRVFQNMEILIQMTSLKDYERLDLWQGIRRFACPSRQISVPILCASVAAPMPIYSSTMAGDVWGQWFTCCITQQPPQRRRRRIDRTMIGEPTNFVHTGHIGSSDVQMANNQLAQLQSQMKSKGGYEEALPHNHMMAVVAVQRT
ncbi:CDC42 small effector protein homolog [Procambarus clarkii]|uniref:CDC42 small effector protein homolog n=1 Tax=Procambarus clarkii TaxID=6728 RepID=UPI001E67106E|nr:CDC42 small effector protein homolog [Procambarus clarkii]